MTFDLIYQHGLLACLFLLLGDSLISQKNEITFLPELEHRFKLTTDTNDLKAAATLLAINDNLDEREVVEVLRDESGLLWIIQPQVVHLYDENTIIESHYFDYENQHITNAFIYSENTIVLLGDNRTIGLLYRKDRMAKKIKYHQLPKNHKMFSITKESIHSLHIANDNDYSIHKFILDNKRIPNWTELYQFTSQDDINHFTFNELNQELLYVSNKSNLVHINQDERVSQSVENIEDGFIKASRIIKHDKGYFIFFSSRQGLYWYEKGAELQRLSDNGMYGYHKYDNDMSLLMGIRKKPKIINTVLHVSAKNINYKYFGFDFDTTIDVISSNFNKEIILYGGNGIYHVSNSTQKYHGIQTHLSDSSKTNFKYGEIITDIQVHNNQVYAVSEISGKLLVKQECPSGIQSDRTFNLLYENSNLFLHKLCSDTINNTLWVTAFDQKRHGSLYKYSGTEIAKELQTDIIIRQVIPQSKNRLLLFGFKKKNQNTYGVILDYDLETKKTEEIFNKLNYDIWTAAKINSKFLCGTKTALFEFSLKTRSIKEIESIENQRVAALRMNNDLLYVCTRSNGIYILNENLDLHKHLDFSKKPISNRVTDIIQDKNQNYWVSTFKGIALLDNHHNFLKRLTIKDGLSSWEFNSFATDTLDQSIFFGSLNGITEINTPTFYQGGDNNVRIYNMKGFYQNDYHSPTISGITYTYKFTPKELAFDSYYINKASPEPNYTTLTILKGDDIIPTIQTNNQIRFTNISTGQYDVYQSTLENESLKVAEIIIKPNHSQLFKYIIYGLFISLISFLIAKLWNSKQKKLIIEKTELENRLVNIKLESLRSQLNPHFVFNCLNSIQYYIQMNEKVLARDYLAKFSKLMRYFLESSRNDKLHVSEEINLLTLYLDLEKLRFENKFDYNISSTLNTDLKIPTMILQPHVENSIVHGISHLEDRVGHIDINFSELENGLECTIIDNGIGREAAQKIKRRKNKNHKSRATQIIEERMTILNNQGNGETNIKYSDKLDTEGKVIGTIANIKFTHSTDLSINTRLTRTNSA